MQGTKTSSATYGTPTQGVASKSRRCRVRLPCFENMPSGASFRGKEFMYRPSVARHDQAARACGQIIFFHRS